MPPEQELERLPRAQLRGEFRGTAEEGAEGRSWGPVGVWTAGAVGAGFTAGAASAGFTAGARSAGFTVGTAGAEFTADVAGAVFTDVDGTVTAAREFTVFGVFTAAAALPSRPL